MKEFWLQKVSEKSKNKKFYRTVTQRNKKKSLSM